MHEKTISKETLYSGKIFNLTQHQVTLSDGRKATRDIIEHPGAAGVVVRHRQGGRYLFVKQYRKAVEEETLEMVAGTLDAGEDPTTCAVRELAEEAHLKCGPLEALGIIYPSPGILTERIHLFLTEVDGEKEILPGDVDEDIECVWLQEEEVEKAIQEGRIRDAKTLSAWALLSVF